MLGTEVSQVSEAWMTNLCCRVAYAAVAFFVWEILITFDEEVEWIWSKPNKFTPMKCLYLFMRYFAFASQIIDEILTTVFANKVLDDNTCRLWHTYHLVTAQCLLTAVEIVLMLRVYALYGRSRVVWAILSTVIFLEFATMLIRSPIMMLNMEWDESCFMVMEPEALVYLGVGGAVTHSVIWALTMYKNIMVFQTERAMSPLLQLIFRDGAMVFMVMASLSIGSSMHEGFRNTFSHPVYAWFLSASSTAGCRLLLHVRAFGLQSDDSRPTVELTSVTPSLMPSVNEEESIKE